MDAEHRVHVHGYVAGALAGGARLLAGGVVPGGPGASYPPTVLADCPRDSAVVLEVTFGPVASAALVSVSAQVA